jgi:hypothetical protein
VFVSISERIFATFGHFCSKLVLRGSSSVIIAELFPKIIKILSKNEKSPTSTGARSPLADAVRGFGAQSVELGHGSSAYFPVFGASSEVSPQILPRF